MTTNEFAEDVLYSFCGWLKNEMADAQDRGDFARAVIYEDAIDALEGTLAAEEVSPDVSTRQATAIVAARGVSSFARLCKEYNEATDLVDKLKGLCAQSDVSAAALVGATSQLFLDTLKAALKTTPLEHVFSAVRTTYSRGSR